MWNQGGVFAENARKLGKEKGKNISVISGFLEEQVEEVKKLNIGFDFIILSSVLHELDDPGKMLKAVYELCGDNTVVHVNVPNANSVHRLIAIEAGLISDVHEQSSQMQKMQRRRTYDMDMLKEEMDKAGFKAVDSGSYFVKPFTHFQMQQCLDQKIFDDRVLLGLENLVKYMPEYGAGIYVDVRKS